MEKVRKILVHLSKDNAAPHCARFVQSITGHFSGSLDDEVMVVCTLENNRFLLGHLEKGRGVPLKRASFCPFKHLSGSEAAAIPLEVQSRGVDVGVAILLQSANQKVLLTRRACTLRIFPNVWVPPGGHVELNERLLDAGLRELREETGLKLQPDEVSPKLLGLWESVYPPMLSRGLPQRHHIVTYMLLHSSLPHHQLQAALRPEPAEVSGCLWVDAPLGRAIVAAVDGQEDSGLGFEDLPPTLSVSEVSPEGALRESVLPVSVLCNRAPSRGQDVERVSTGTKYALELWLNTLPETHTDPS
ncbi:nucleoside diphosphate-linked moiety X motif 17 [Aplochiton taeniatus]